MRPRSNRKIPLIVLLVSVVTGNGTPAASQSPDLRSRVAAITASLTLDEKIMLLSGRDDWHVGGIERMGLPLMRVSDCGHGVTLAAPPFGSATCLPTGVGMASTWDEDLLFEAGELLGRETRAKGCGLLLGPMVNLHRHPLGGRNFETFSEDPLLAGRMSAALIRGIQSAGTGACIKAMAGNNQQKAQHSTSVEMDERTLRELYLRAFEIAVDDSAPWAIMTSYNPLRGIQTSENPHLLTEIVRQDWDFKGMIVSDWRAVESIRALGAGLNLEMPGPGRQLTAGNVREALADGRVTMDQVDAAIAPIIEVLLKYQANVRGPSELDSPRHRDIARRLAEESLVLLKNEQLLPFDSSRLKSLAVIGPNAAHARLGGGGSASVTPFYAVSPLDGLRRLVGSGIRIDYAEGGGMEGGLPAVPTANLRTGALETSPAGLRAEFFSNRTLQGEPCATRIDPTVDFAWGWAAPMNGVPRFGFSVRWTGWLVPPSSGRYRLNLVSEQARFRVWLDGKLLMDGWDDGLADKFEERYTNRSLEGTVELVAGKSVPLIIEFSKTGPKTAVRLQWETPDHDDPVDAASRLAARCDAAVVFVGLSNLHEGGNQDRASYALPGRQVELIRRVAAANPRVAVVLINGSVVSVAEWIDSVPAVMEAWYPGQEGGNAIAAALFGSINPGGRLPDTLFRSADDILALRNYPGDGKRVTYGEGMKVGYRQIRPTDTNVMFPFGFGLSYTQFELGEASNDQEGVSVLVRNSGAMAGSTVVQVYRQRAHPADDDPWRELVAFRKVTLKPGESRVIHLPLAADAFRSWSETSNGWQRDPRLTSLWITLDARSGQELPLPTPTGG